MLPEPIELKDYKAHESIITMFYGASGTGKTEIAGTAGNRALIINTGKGTSTLKSPGFKARHPNCNPLIVDIAETVSDHGYIEKSAMYDMVCDVLDEQLQKNPDRFDTVVLDDLTSLRRSALVKGMEINQASGRSTSKGTSSKLKIAIKAVQDFGIEMDLISQFINGYAEILSGMKKNFIVLAHERLTYKKGDKLGDIPVLAKVRPAVTGEKFPDDIPQMFDVVGYTNVLRTENKTVYRVKFSADNIVMAKNRWGGVPIPFNSKETYDGQVTNFNLEEFIHAVHVTQNPATLTVK